ncbi:hypothetical protein KUV23_05600 [Algoriphagus marincola]|uniref:Uncharacterized protein n=1 Tax=Algoriphagus marincola TaxID=264027 RepID=A0ABS7N3F5_9BACT|nr:hypothetical protein [Algoriphagus marincola]MBY5950438.1 hypothetical protein [Algoriphagus marincola]
MQSKTAFFLLIVFSSCFFANELMAQQQELDFFNTTRTDFNRKGMVILGSWAVGNMLWGGIAASQTTGSDKAFHQMNLYWNSVNLIIAGFGYWQASKSPEAMSLWETIEAQQGIEKVLLVNAALDFGYMAGGLYLKERGLRKNNERLQGFGKSIILQGAFLLTFDAIMYGFHSHHAQALPEFVNQLSLGPTGFSLRIPLQ